MHPAEQKYHVLPPDVDVNFAVFSSTIMPQIGSFAVSSLPTAGVPPDLRLLWADAQVTRSPDQCVRRADARSRAFTRWRVLRTPTLVMIRLRTNRSSIRYQGFSEDA